MRKTRLFSILALLFMAVSGAWAQDYYAPSTDEVIILNDVYDDSKSGYSSHSAIAWGGSASASKKKAGDPNKGGQSTSSTVNCYSVKGTGKGKNITLSITGVSKVIVYHQRGNTEYIELRDGSKKGNIIGSGQTNTFYTEVALTATNKYSIFLHGTDGEDDQDFYVYAIKLIAAAAPADPAPAATGYTVTLAEGTEDAANWTIEPNAGLNGGETVTITYNGTKRIQSVTAVQKAATPAVQARTWNFTQWSEATVNNIKADAAASKTEGWSDIEKEKDAKDGKSAGETEDKCFWYQGEINSDGTLSANGSVIEELKGLKFNEEYASRRDLAIAVDYSSTVLGDYAGGAYLMLGGGKVSSPDKRICCFTIPNVKIGQKITVVVESHKPSTGRGISLFVNSVKDDDNKIGDSFMPTTKESYTWENWTLPDNVTADGDTVDILVYNNDVCHIYSITVE